MVYEILFKFGVEKSKFVKCKDNMPLWVVVVPFDSHNWSFDDDQYIDDELMMMMIKRKKNNICWLLVFIIHKNKPIKYN